MRKQSGRDDRAGGHISESSIDISVTVRVQSRTSQWGRDGYCATAYRDFTNGPGRGRERVWGPPRRKTGWWKVEVKARNST